MVKRTLHFGNPTRLGVRNAQLLIQREGHDDVCVPLEDIGVVVLEHPQISLSHAVLSGLLEQGAALISSDAHYHPTGLLLNLEGHCKQSARFQAQCEATLPLKKQLWQQTVKAKLLNQAAMLEKAGVSAAPLRKWATEVLSGDTSNLEGRAAAWYWRHLFDEDEGFVRDRKGAAPNHLLNYGYAILRATVARGLVASGLLPTLGIHHRNQYNAYCLADDVMEPYRPLVDNLVYEIWRDYKAQGGLPTELDVALKRKLLVIPAMDIRVDGRGYPLMVGLQRTTTSIAECFEGKQRKILYPEFWV